MKYSIIAAVIAVAITVLLLFLDNGLTKQDKFILIVLIILLTLTGGYFTVKALKKEDVDFKKQGVTLDTTLINTESIKSKADSIISNLDESLNKVIEINDSIVGFNKSLIKVQKDVSKQIKILENTLTQTKIFEEKVAEQVKIEKLRFQNESAKIVYFANQIKFVESQKDSTQVSFYFLTNNRGKRSAINITSNILLLLLNNKDEVFKHEYRKLSIDFITPGDRYKFESMPLYSKESFGNKLNSAIILIQTKYFDESDKIPLIEKSIYRWNNKISDNLIFNDAEINYKKIALDYISSNTFDGIEKFDLE